MNSKSFKKSLKEMERDKIEFENNLSDEFDRLRLEMAGDKDDDYGDMLLPTS